jgi:hypothetical protein
VTEKIARLMTAARLWLTLYLSGFGMLASMGLSSLLTPVAYGDLTRIGRVSEYQFGWRRSAPDLPLSSLAITRIEEANVLVIGDSFSAGGIWQSILTRSGLRVATAHWDDVGPICTDFGAWLARSGFTGHTVIVESIERSVNSRISAGRDCAISKKEYKASAGARQQPPTQPPPLTFNHEAQLAAGMITLRNGLRIASGKGDVVMRSPEWGNRPLVAARRVAGGCELFSHRMCSRALFLTDDTTLASPTPQDAEDMAT